MKRINYWTICGFVVSAFGISACVSIDTYLRPGVKFSNYSKIAVVDFVSAHNQSASGLEVADLLGVELLKRGYDVIERNQLQVILKEQKLSQSGIIDPSNAVKIGEITGVDAIITGVVGEYSDKSDAYASAYVARTKRTTYVSLTVKLIDVKDGRLLWSASGSRKGGFWASDVPRQVSARSILKRLLEAFPINPSVN